MMSPAAQCRLRNRQARKAREANAMWEAEQEENAKEMWRQAAWLAAVVIAVGFLVAAFQLQALSLGGEEPHSAS
eukprot:SAG22_NODE_1050_length_5831_cov_4.044138_3_plen_74_part_00